jgi:hypothetical protein
MSNKEKKETKEKPKTVSLDPIDIVIIQEAVEEYEAMNDLKIKFGPDRNDQKKKEELVKKVHDIEKVKRKLK